MELMLPTLTAKVVCVSPAVKLTLAGTVNWLLLLVKATVVLPVGPADSVSVQVADPGALIELGEQDSEDGWTVTVKLMVADWLCPLRVAVTVAFCAALTVPVVAENVVLL